MLFWGESNPAAANELGADIIKSLHRAPDPLSSAFFSAANIARIQGDLRTIILHKTGFTIGNQSNESLVTIMRAMYALHATQNSSVDAEVRRLNAIVLAEIAPMVGTGISQYLGYLHDASTLAVPMERPQNMSIKGRNTMGLFRPL